MTANIEIAPPSVNTVLSDAEFQTRLEAVAREIQHFERSAIFRIANRLAWVHGQFLYRRDEGGFQGWVESRLGYSRAKAYRLLGVAKLIESVSGWDAFGTLPATALYQLAAPSTPVPVRDEVLDRLKAGERLSCAMVTEAIESAAAAAREQDGAAPGAAESTEPADDADDAAKSGEAREEFYDDTDRAEHDDDGGDGGRHHHGGGDADDDAGDDRRGGGDDHDEEPEPAPPKSKPPKSKPDLETLEEQQGIRDRVLADFFAQAAGAHIAALIPATKHADVVRPLLDQLGVDGMLQAMSLEFGNRLRAKLPRMAKPFKIATLKGRGSRPRAHH